MNNYQPPQIFVIDADEYHKPSIDAERVEEIVKDCLYKPEELAVPEEALTVEELPEGAVMAEGILHHYAFHPERLESHRVEVEQMLRNLPLAFRPQAVGGGGGWSFLNACQDVNDVQWTGFHLRMEQLFCLGIALGVASWLLPKDMWESLPGGMPYVMVKI